MHKDDIKNTVIYLKHLEEQLPELDFSELNIHMSKTYKTIEMLMNATFDSTDSKEKSFLAYLEMKARKSF